MKNLLKVITVSVLLASLTALTGCGSKPTEDEPIISTVSANHITVNLSNSKVAVILNKTADEDVSKILVENTMDESLVTVNMTEEKASFIWPFAEEGKEYVLCAKVINSKDETTAKEYVSFKVEGTPAVKINNEAFDNSTLVLVAKGNKRIVRFNTTQDALKAVTSALETNASKLKIDIYSGKHYNTDISEATKVATLEKEVSNKTDLEEVFEGYDLIEKASVFELTPTEMNAALSKAKTYFAVATVDFTLGDNKDITFSSKTLYSNDTIYTPIRQRDLLLLEGAIVDTYPIDEVSSEK